MISFELESREMIDIFFIKNLVELLSIQTIFNINFLNQFSRIRIILMIVLLNNVLTINYNLNFDFVYLVMWDNLMSELERERLERNNIRLLFCCMCSSNITIGTYHGSSNNSCTHIIKINFNLMYMKILWTFLYVLILDHIF